MLINKLQKTNRLSNDRFNKLKQFIIPIGLLMLASSILINRFLPNTESLDFVSGFLMGLSMVINIAGILIFSYNYSNKFTSGKNKAE